MRSKLRLGTSLDWFGLVWTGLDWFGQVWTGLDWFGLVWTGLDWSGLVEHFTVHEFLVLFLVAFSLEN